MKAQRKALYFVLGCIIVVLTLTGMLQVHRNLYMPLQFVNDAAATWSGGEAEYGVRYNTRNVTDHNAELKSAVAAGSEGASPQRRDTPRVPDVVPEAVVAAAAAADEGTRQQQQQVPAYSYTNNVTLNDKTLEWSTQIDRLWLRELSLKDDKRRPPAQLLLTNLGWNNPDPVHALTFPRSTRSRKLTQAVVDHPWFHPKGWEDLNHKLVNNVTLPVEAADTRYYVFLDVETCFESNWPHYAQGERINYDTDSNRTFSLKNNARCNKLWRCQPVRRALEHAIFHTPSINATLVVFDCSGDGQIPDYRRITTRDDPLAIVTLSSEPHQMVGLDQGLAPPAPKPVVLSRQQIADISNCQTENETRPMLLSFAGNFRHRVRQKLRKLNNDKDVVIVHRHKLNHASFWNGTFEDFLTSSKFAATPRGDNKFSYRFTEVLSAGAIPVVHSDGWVLAFREELVDWKECAVIIPEARASETLDILAEIGDAERCRRRQRCYEIYNKYMRTHDGTVAGVIEGLELAQTKAAAAV